MKNTIGEIINDELTKIDRTVYWLAKKIGMKYNTLYAKLTMKKNGGLKDEDLLKIAKVLNIDLNKLRDEIKLEEE